MATYYPSCLSKSEYCTKCNTAQDPGSGCSSRVSSNTTKKAYSCSTYCNSGCNSKCNQAQTVCVIMGQYIKNHADVGAYHGSTIKSGDFIHEKWTIDYWDELIEKIDTAEDVGRLSKHGSAGNVTAEIKKNAPFTATLYNEINAKLCNFNVSYDEVEKNDLITATIANAIGTAYNKATFDSSVCDMCNSDQTMRGGCGCNCSCSCSCNCGCSCNCNCTCNCGCSKPCNCSSNTAS